MAETLMLPEAETPQAAGAADTEAGLDSFASIEQSDQFAIPDTYVEDPDKAHKMANESKTSEENILKFKAEALAAADRLEASTGGRESQDASQQAIMAMNHMGESRRIADAMADSAGKTYDEAQRIREKVDTLK